jgi:hypothetical protein
MILEDPSGLSNVPITLTSPAGVATIVPGFPTDVSESVDPETGVVVSGHQAAVAISLLALIAAGVEMPTGVVEKSRRPWLVAFTDATGEAHTWKVVEALPDRTVALVRLLLEGYRAGTN